MSLKVVVGAGATGIPAALLLAQAGDQVRLVSRRGSGPDHPNVELVKADAADPAGLSEVARGAAVIFNCAMPPYDQWPALWPPLAASLLAAAERTGADYVMVGNAYGYGPVAGPMTEDLPLAATTAKGRVRAQMWLDAKAAAQRGLAFDAILARTWPAAALTSFSSPLAGDCEPVIAAHAWLQHEMPKWDRRLAGEAGYEEPALPAVCEVTAGRPYADAGRNRIYIRRLQSDDDRIALAHEYLHLAFEHHPRGLDEVFIEQAARDLILKEPK